MVLHVGMGIENPRLIGGLGCFGRKCSLFMRVYRHPLRSGISFVHAVYTERAQQIPWQQTHKWAGWYSGSPPDKTVTN